MKNLINATMCFAIGALVAPAVADPAHGPDFQEPGVPHAVDHDAVTSQSDGEILPSDVILFGFDSVELDAADDLQLGAAARWLLDHPHHRLIVEAYTDHAGPEAYNLHLAKGRARMVRAQLRVLGIEPGRVTSVIYGEGASLGVSDEADRRVVVYATELTTSQLIRRGMIKGDGRLD